MRDENPGTVPTMACACEDLEPSRRMLIWNGMIIASEASEIRVKNTEQRTRQSKSTTVLREHAVLSQAHLPCICL